MPDTSSRPNVLVVTPWFPTAKKPGGGIFILRDVLMLTRLFNVTVVHVGAPQFLSSDSETEPVWDEFTTLRAPITFSNYRSIIDAARVIRRHLRSADALHTMAFEGLTPLLLIRVAVPWVHTEHWSGLLTDPKGTWRSRQVQSLLRRALRRPRTVIAVSQYLAEAMRRWTKEPVRVIGNEVQLPPALPEQVAWNFTTIRMIAVGALEESKGVHHAVETLIELVGREYDAELTCVGEGSLTSKLTERATHAKVEHRVRLLGQLPPDAVRYEMRRANIAVMPTVSETFGVALAESVAEGLPVVTGDTGGFRDFLPTRSSVCVPASEFSGARIADEVIALTERDDLPTRHDIAETAAAIFSDTDRLERYRQVFHSLGVVCSEVDPGEDKL